MERYKVALVGLGPRGEIHAKAFIDNSDRFELAAICDLNEQRLQSGAEQFGVAQTYIDAEQMLAEVRPDVFCFATLPNVRLQMVELAVKYRVKAIAFEKPIALKLKDAKRIRDLCAEHGIKAIICHQHKYLEQFSKLAEIVRRGDIGRIERVHATTKLPMAQLGTHYLDYILWILGEGEPRWVVGHIHGKKKLDDKRDHNSPDFLLGEFYMSTGVRAFIECGYLSPVLTAEPRYDIQNRLTVYGTHGFAWVETDGQWAAFSKNTAGQLDQGRYDPWKVQIHRINAPYLRDLADWLDDDGRVHPSNIEAAYQGFLVLQGLCLSALDGTRIDLPMEERMLEGLGDLTERMKLELPEVADSDPSYWGKDKLNEIGMFNQRGGMSG